MERIQIHTDNSPELKDNIDDFKAKFGNLLSKGPSDSSLCCCLEKADSTFVMNLRVHSSHGHFPLHLEDADSKKLISEALATIKEQFRVWHENPEDYAASHDMGLQPCTQASGEVLKCPIGSPANKAFERKAGL